MIGLGLASTHAPAIFCPPEVWPKVYDAIPSYMKGAQPHTAKNETPEVIRQYLARTDKAFDTMRRALEEYRPDALIIVGDDQDDLFNESNMPAFSVYTGTEVWGSTAPYYVDLPDEASRVTIPCHQEIARYILKGLFRKGFDPAYSERMQPIGRRGRGMSHMVMYPAPKLMPRYDIPIVPILINEYFPPLMSGERCWQLGLALAEILANRPERVAIYASGGMSHDPAGPRAGWIDEPLDRWFLERIERNEGERLAALFSFDSATLRGGTGELRAWIVAAAACRRPGTVLEYIPCHHAKTGLGFVTWPAVEANVQRLREAAE